MVGRTDEQARLTALIEAAREGRSGALLLHGPPGIGKTELLRFAESAASGFVVLRARGMESESGIPFAGLAELVGPLLGFVDEIPAVQADALRAALALGPATAADRFTVPAALLSLLARAADDGPVLAIVDDAHWLDEPSLEAFLFAGRRLAAEGVAMLGAARDGARRIEVPWLERLAVAPLADADARELLDASIAPGVADRLVATAAGNPLALLEIPALLTAPQLAGRAPLADPLPPGTGVERAFAVALEALPAETRAALLVAAAAGTRRLDVLGRALAAARPASPPPGAASLDALGPAEAAGIVTLGGGELEFRHPLMRSTVYHAAGPVERRAAHAALAAAVDGAERAWHLAACAVAPDEAVAAALEAAALEARGRGAHATAARDLQRAAQLTPDPEPRARRLLAAAGDAVRSGDAEQAGALLDAAAALAGGHAVLDDPLLLADIERLRGHVEMRRGSPVEANERLVAEADRVRGRDPRRAAAMFLEASVAHLMTGDPAALLTAAERARALSAGTEPAVELLATAVIGEAQLALGEVEQGVAELRACEPYLMEADPLGDGRDRRHGRARVDVGRGLGPRGAHPRPHPASRPRRERRVRAHPPARGASAPGPAPWPLGGGARGRVRGGRARRGRRAARTAPPRARRTRARGGRAGARGRLPRPRRARPGAVRRPPPARGARSARARARTHPRGDRRAGDGRAADAAARARVVGRAAPARPDRGLRPRRSS